MNEWTIIRMLLVSSTDMDLVRWSDKAEEWIESSRDVKVTLGIRLRKVVARELKFRETK